MSLMTVYSSHPIASLPGRLAASHQLLLYLCQRRHRQHRAITLLTRATPFMSKKPASAALMVDFLLVSSNFAQSPSALSVEDEEVRLSLAVVF